MRETDPEKQQEREQIIQLLNQKENLSLKKAVDNIILRENPVELDLSFLQPKFENLQKTIKTLYSVNGVEGLKEYADKSMKKTLSALERQIERELKSNAAFAKKYNSKQIKDFAREILRREHIEYLSTLYPEEGIIKNFQIDDKSYSSAQVPVGKLHNCYRRWTTGLAAFRKHTFKAGDETLMEYYHHSSPVVYEEPDFKKRIEGTIENFKQVVRDTGGKPVTEIRLLSTTSQAGGDKKQAVETYLAAILASTPEQPITVFFHGVNLARYLRGSKFAPKFLSPDGGFQTWLNTRSCNTLFEKILKQANIDNSDLKQKLEHIEGERNKLKQKIEVLFSSGADEETIKSKFEEYLKEHHKSEVRNFEIYKKLLLNNPAISKETAYDLKILFDLLKADEDLLTPPEYNGQIQAALLRLSRNAGETVATGCNDAKDRDGMVSIVVEANEIYRQRHGKYPDIIQATKDSALRKEMKEIQTEVFLKSTAASVAENVSWPEMAKGLDNADAPGSGFKHLPNDGKMAGYLKVAYHDFYHNHSENIKKTSQMPAYINKKPELVDHLQEGKANIAKIDFQKAGYSAQRKEYLLGLFPKDKNISLDEAQKNKLIGTLYAQYKSIKDPKNPLSLALERTLCGLLNVPERDIAHAEKKKTGFWYKRNPFNKGKKSADPVFKLINKMMNKDMNADAIHQEARKVERSAMAIMLSQSAPAEKNKVAMNLFAEPVKKGQKIDAAETQHNFDLLQQQLELESHKSTDEKLNCMIKFRNSMTLYLKNHSSAGIFHSRQERVKYLDRFIMDKAHEYDRAAPEQKGAVLMRIALELYVHYEAILKVNDGKLSGVSKQLQTCLAGLLDIKIKDGENMRDAITKKMTAAGNHHWNINDKVNEMIELTHMEISSSKNNTVKVNDFSNVFKDFDENKSNNDVVRPGQLSQHR